MFVQERREELTRSLYKVHAITTGKQHNDQLVNILQEIHPYLDYIHLREKAKSAKELIELIHMLANRNIPLSKLVLNDRVDVAALSGVKGVQLAYDSLPVQLVKHKFSDLMVGRSVHSLEEALIAEREGADYVLFGHVYSSQSKQGVTPRGLPSLIEIKQSVSIPVIAIGGITPENYTSVLETGVAGIAIMSGVFEASDPLAAIKRYRNYE